MTHSAEILDHRISNLEESHSELLQVMRGIESSLAKLVIIDDRQVQAALALERISTRQDKIDDRLVALEKADVNQSRAADMVDKMVWGAAGLAVMFAAGKVGLF